MIAADFVGVELPNRYVFGYGMDVRGAWRNLPAVYAAHWAGLIPGAEAAVLPGIGHAVPSEAPAAFCGLVEDFLRRIER